MLSRKRIYDVLEVANPGDRVSRLVDLSILALILLNITAVILESVPAYKERFGSIFQQFELVSVALFSAEYVLRIWSSVEDEKFCSPIGGRVRFAMSPQVLVDLLAVLPFYLSLGIDARFLRVLRILKLARYIKSLQILQRVVYRKRGQLAGTLIVLGVMLIFTSCLIWSVEHKVNPNIDSIPAAMWWSVVTLTTVGFGDTVPVTSFGKFAAGFVAVIGISMFAFPTAVLGAGFLEEVNNDHKICPHCGKET
jgi:voltage-gated potassium channel